MGLHFQQKTAPLRIFPTSFAQDRLAASVLLPDGDAPHGKHRIPAQGMEAALAQHSRCHTACSPPGTATLSPTALCQHPDRCCACQKDLTAQTSETNEESIVLPVLHMELKADETTAPGELSSSELGSGFPPSL